MFDLIWRVFLRTRVDENLSIKLSLGNILVLFVSNVVSNIVLRNSIYLGFSNLSIVSRPCPCLIHARHA